MTKRKGLSKKLRFDIFKRDSFICQYCGGNPPNVILEVDHVEPVSLGGKDDIDNLITSCFDCNRGKGAGKLDSIPDTLIQKTEVIKERENQLKEMEKLSRQVKSRLSRQSKKVSDRFSSYFPDKELTPVSLNSIKTQFLSVMDIESILDCMDLACLRIDEPGDAYRYFCGICWNKIKGKGYGKIA